MIMCLSGLIYYNAQHYNIAFIDNFRINLEKYFNLKLMSLTDYLKVSVDSTANFYPHLPIFIYRDVLNISLLVQPKKSKLILLFNQFFGDHQWDMKTLNINSSMVTRELHCPFLDGFCEITNNQSRFKSADAVIFHMRDFIDKQRADTYRNVSQRFVFSLWESPLNSPDMNMYRNFFNWTWSYRFDSHIVSTYFFQYTYLHGNSPYFKQLLRENSSKSLSLAISSFNFTQLMFKTKRNGTAAALISNCGAKSKRLQYIAELQKYIDVHVYERCGKACPSNINCREFLAHNYYFLLSFENSLCNDYTSKFFVYS